MVKPLGPGQGSVGRESRTTVLGAKHHVRTSEVDIKGNKKHIVCKKCIIYIYIYLFDTFRSHTSDSQSPRKGMQSEHFELFVSIPVVKRPRIPGPPTC